MFLLVLGFSEQLLAEQQQDPNKKKDFFEMSIEELMNVEVQSAGFFTTTTTKAPGYVMVYDMDKIKDSSVRTLADLMELYVPGVVIGHHDRQGAEIGMRGLLIDNSAKTLVMWDGQQINYRAHFGYMVGMLSPFLGDISKVEVIQGPGAIQHGSGAIGGFINMIPKTGSSHPGFFTHYEYGIMEQSNLFEAGYGFKYGDKRDVYVYGGGYGARGFEPDEYYGAWYSGKGHKNYTQDVDAFGYPENNYRFSTTWNYDNFNLNWFIYSLNPQKNSPNEFGYFMNQATGLRPQYTFELNNTDAIELNGSFFWGDYGSVGHNLNDYMKGGSERHWEIKPVFKTTRFENHQIAIGGLYGYKNFRNEDMYFHHKALGNLESLDTQWFEKGLFAEDVITLTNRLTTALGVRYDKYELDDVTIPWPAGSFTPEEIKGHISPRIAFAYEIDKKTNIKASYQHGFRMPDAAYYHFNVYNNNVAQSFGLPQFPLKPETMDSWELDFQKVFSSKLTGGLNLFYNTFTDQLAYNDIPASWSDSPVPVNWNGDGVSFLPGMFQNISGSYHIWGFEVPVKYALTDNIDVDVSYGFAKIIDNIEHNVTQKYPPHQVKINLTSRFLEDRLLIGLNYVYNSNYTHSLNPSIADCYEDSRNLVDLFVVYKVNKNLRFKGVVQNLFAERTPPPGNQMSDPSYMSNLGYDEPRMYLSAEMLF
jgi:outer membrane receptor protein involved in Fe transport